MTHHLDLNFLRRNCKYPDVKKPTQYGLKHRGFDDITGTVRNGWRVVSYAFSYLGTTWWFIECAACGFRPEKAVSRQAFLKRKTHECEGRKEG